MDKKQAEISEKEKQRREKISIARKKTIKKNRERGYNAYVKRMRRYKRILEELEEGKNLESETLSVKKRKVGRPRKRGPKKKRKYVSRKKKIDGRTCSLYKRTIDYKIVTVNNGVQNGRIGCYKTIEDAYAAFGQFKKDLKPVIFPRQIKNNGKISRFKDECLILQKNRDNSDSVTMLRNEFGKLVEHKTNLQDWFIIDKYQYEVEETFWVFGRNPRTERVTFMWVFQNLLLNGLGEDSDFKRVLIYKNKFIIKDDNSNIDIVFCKNTSDAVRFYNLMESMCIENKIKNVIFSGSYSDISDRRRKLEEELCKFTGFSKAKIQMSVTKNCKH